MINNAQIYDNSGAGYKLLLEIRNKNIKYSAPIINSWAKSILSDGIT